jgi:hypothetical protein
VRHSEAKARDFALEILKLEEPSQWQLERIIQRAIDYGRGEKDDLMHQHFNVPSWNPFPENEGT